MVNSSDRPQTMTAEHVVTLLRSLEAADITRAVQAVCVELLDACETAVFVFVRDDPSRVVRFGEEGAERPVQAPHLDNEGSFGFANRIEGAPGSSRSWRALLPLLKGDDSIGVLQIACDQPVGEPGIDVLKVVASTLALAVQNALKLESTKRLTFMDDLTALYNSRFMTLCLDQEIKRCRRMRSPLSLLFMDLDGFKKINDTHGHLAGSKTLVEVGAVLGKTVRDTDVLIRFGGDEFVILFPETPLSGGLVIAERIRRVIEGTNFLESQQLEARVSASVGIAAYPESADDARGLIASADRAMYEAKSLGKNRVVAAKPLPLP